MEHQRIIACAFRYLYHPSIYSVLDVKWIKGLGIEAREYSFKIQGISDTIASVFQCDRILTLDDEEARILKYWENFVEASEESWTQNYQVKNQNYSRLNTNDRLILQAFYMLIQERSGNKPLTEEELKSYQFARGDIVKAVERLGHKITYNCIMVRIEEYINNFQIFSIEKKSKKYARGPMIFYSIADARKFMDIIQWINPN